MQHAFGEADRQSHDLGFGALDELVPFDARHFDEIAHRREHVGHLAIGLGGSRDMAFVVCRACANFLIDRAWPRSSMIGQQPVARSEAVGELPLSTLLLAFATCIAGPFADSVDGRMTALASMSAATTPADG